MSWADHWNGLPMKEFIKITFRLTAVLMLQLHTPSSRDFEHSSFANNLRINLAEKAHF